MHIHKNMIYLQVLVPSSSAGQCGSTAICEASVPISDVTLTFEGSTVVAGEKTDMQMSMLVAVPILTNQTIDVALPGFTASGVTSFSFDTTSVETDPAFVLNNARSIPAWSKLGCIRDVGARR